MKSGNFYHLSVFNSSDLGFKSKKVFLLQFFVDILPFGSVSVDPHNFADPKHWYTRQILYSLRFCYEIHLQAYWTPKLCTNIQLYSGIYKWSCSRWCRDISRISPLQRKLSSTDGLCKFFFLNISYLICWIV